MNICSPCFGDFAFAKYLCLGCLEDVTLGNTRMLVYMAPRSYSALGNTRMLNKLTKVSHTFQLFIHATKITNFWLQQHNHFLECSLLPLLGLPSDVISVGPEVGGFSIILTLFTIWGQHAQGTKDRTSSPTSPPNLLAVVMRTLKALIPLLST